jgi:hypothetical protein
MPDSRRAQATSAWAEVGTATMAASTLPASSRGSVNAREALAAILSCAVSRVLVELVFELSSGPILVRLMVTGLPFERVWVDRLVDEILEGVRGGRR